MLRKTLIVAILTAFLGAISVWVVGSVEMGTRRHPWTAETSPPGIEPVQFVASDGVPLKGWWWPAGDSSRVVVLLHGMGADRLQMLPRAQWLHSIGYAALLFDFRGCGESGGESSPGDGQRVEGGAGLACVPERQGGARPAVLGRGGGA